MIYSLSTPYVGEHYKLHVTMKSRYCEQFLSRFFKLSSCSTFGIHVNKGITHKHTPSRPIPSSLKIKWYQSYYLEVKDSPKRLFCWFDVLFFALDTKWLRASRFKI